MIWDPCLTRAVAAELNGRLRGARARAVSLRRGALAAVVHFRDATLVADLSPQRGTVLLRPPSEPDGGADPLPAVLAGAEAVSDERVLVLRFRRVRGRKPNPGLILELAPNRRNAILAEGPELRVRKRLRVVKGRTPRIGQPWAAPGDGSSARERGEPDAAGWRRLIEGSDEAGARAALLANVAYTSALNAGALLDAPTLDEGFRRWRRLATGTKPAPHLLGSGSALQPYPWALPGTVAEPVPSLLEGMARVADTGAGRGEADRRLSSESRRLKRRLKRLRAQLERTTAAERIRAEAVLILSSLHLIEPGAARATLVDFDGNPQTVRIDARHKPQEHANALFRRARRLERGAATLADRIRATEDELTRIEALREGRRRGGLSDEDLEALGPPRPEGGGKRVAHRALPYRACTSSGGLEIRVGRGGRHNDDLTFHHSRPDDIWLHARHAAGAHVILRWTRPERPPATDLEEAAVLAASHSRARDSGTVPVDWTRRKWVRKPRGARPGAVVPGRVGTLFVTPDSRLAERLRRR